MPSTGPQGWTKWRDHMLKKCPTFMFSDQIMKYEALIPILIRAHREKNFPLYVKVLRLGALFQVNACPHSRYEFFTSHCQEGVWSTLTLFFLKHQTSFLRSFLTRPMSKRTRLWKVQMALLDSWKTLLLLDDGCSLDQKWLECWKSLRKNTSQKMIWRIVRTSSTTSKVSHHRRRSRNKQCPF